MSNRSLCVTASKGAGWVHGSRLGVPNSCLNCGPGPGETPLVSLTLDPYYRTSKKEFLAPSTDGETEA